MALDIIGKLSVISGDVENPTIAELAGWHVNSTSSIPEAAKWEIPVKSPKQTYFGVKTYFYCFENENEALSVLKDYLPKEE